MPEKEEKVEDLTKKWNKPTQLLSTSNLGYFVSHPLYVKLYELLKGTYSTYKVINSINNLFLLFIVSWILFSKR